MLLSENITMVQTAVQKKHYIRNLKKMIDTYYFAMLHYDYQIYSFSKLIITIYSILLSREVEGCALWSPATVNLLKWCQFTQSGCFGRWEKGLINDAFLPNAERLFKFSNIRMFSWNQSNPIFKQCAIIRIFVIHI